MVQSPFPVYAPLMSQELLDLTEDEFEREILLADDHAALDPDDPMYEELDNLATHISNLSRTLPTKQRAMVPYLRANMTNVEVAEKVDSHPATVKTARDNPTVQRVMNLLQRVHLIHQGPTEQQRLYMLWSIAKRNYIDSPNTTIRAIDVINKQTQTYQVEEIADGRVVVNIQNFTLNAAHADTHEKIKDITPAQTAEFTPLVVDTTPDA